MPRKLPWQTGSTIAASRGPNSKTTAAASTSTSTAKRQKRETPESDVNSDAIATSSSARNTRNDAPREPSTTPPPEAPPEIFMRDGIENDDKYRMVEDEFLTVAHQFTNHLHAAEYERQQTLVKSRNLDTIDSISRPVAGKMKGNVKRKMESANRTKAQRNALQVLVGKKDRDSKSDDSENEDLPYYGKSLHGLMDSPKKKPSSLVKDGPIVATTRAAAGFKKPSIPISTSTSKPIPNPPKPRILKAKPQVEPDTTLEGSETESDDDDDLDAPIAVPKFTAVDANKENVPVSQNSSISKASQMPKDVVGTGSKPSLSTPSIPQAEPKTVTNVESPPKRRSRLSRREYAKMRRAKLEPSKIEKFDFIPTFS